MALREVERRLAWLTLRLVPTGPIAQAAREVAAGAYRRALQVLTPLPADNVLLGLALRRFAADAAWLALPDGWARMSISVSAEDQPRVTEGMTEWWTARADAGPGPVTALADFLAGSCRLCGAGWPWCPRQASGPR